MAASEMALGENHPATRTVQPAPTTRRAQLSGEAFGDHPKLGYTADIKHDSVELHDHNPDG